MFENLENPTDFDYELIKIIYRFMTIEERTELVNSIKNTFSQNDLIATKELAKTKIVNELKAKGYNVELENENLRLTNTDGSDVYVENKKIDFNTFAESVLANNKLIVTAPQNNNQINKPNPAPAQNTNVNTSKFSAAMDGLLSEINN